MTEVSCRECGAVFNLSRQNYYTNLCPDCVPEKRTWPMCANCGDPADPDTAVQKYVNPRGPAEGGYLTYHPTCVPSGGPR